MAMYSIDAEIFISEISKRPVIWDLTCTENKLKRLKDRAWADVARYFIKEFDDMPECKKTEIFRKLQGKWRNLRDNYVRSLRRKSKRYTYFKNLSFLDAVYEQRPSKPQQSDAKESLESYPSEDRLSDLKPDELDMDSDACINIKAESSSEDDGPSVIDNLKRRRRDSDRTKFQQNVPEPEEIRISTVYQDEDKLFFDSLLPVVHEFNLDQKLEFRTQLLQLLKRIRSNVDNSNVLGT